MFAGKYEMTRLLIAVLIFVSAAASASADSGDYGYEGGVPALVSDLLSSDPALIEKAGAFIKENRPIDAAEQLKHTALNDRRHERRRAAFEALQLYPPDSITEIWIEFVRNCESLVMKSEAIRYLDSYNSRTLVPVFAAELKSRYHAVREAAALGLKKYGSDRVYPVILTLGESPDPVERIYAVEAMFHLYDSRLSRIMNDLLRDSSHSVRIYAVNCAVENNLDDKLPVIRDIARDDENSDVRVAAIKALGKMKDVRALNVLADGINDSSKRVRLKSAESVYQIGSNTAAGFMTERLQSEEDEEVIEKILDCLILFRRAETVRPLEKIVTGPYNVRLRIQTAYLLGIINNQNAVSPLLKALSDGDHRVRAEAAASLGNYGGRNTVNELLNSVRDDRVRYVRSSALYSLKKINDKTALLPLFSIFADEKDPVFRMILERVIKELIERYV